MGQKVSPIGLRIGINKGWEANWYADGKDFSKYLENDIQIRKYVTKNFVTRLDTEVSVDKIAGENVAIVEDKTFDLLDDGTYSNKYDLVDIHRTNERVLKNSWKSATQYEFSFNGKCPVSSKHIYLVAVYTDGTTAYLSKLDCDDSFKDSTIVKSVAGKTIDKVSLIYYSNAQAGQFLIKDVVAKEVR